MIFHRLLQFRVNARGFPIVLQKTSGYTFLGRNPLISKEATVRGRERYHFIKNKTWIDNIYMLSMSSNSEVFEYLELNIIPSEKGSIVQETDLPHITKMKLEKRCWVTKI